MKSFKVIGIDPGFRDLGWCVVTVFRDSYRVDDLGTVKTKKSTKKQNVYATDDNVRRAREILEVLAPLVWSDVPATLITTEAQSWPRNASSTAKVGMFWGVLIAITRGIPMLQVSPQDLKNHITGKKTSSKDEIIDALITLGLDGIDLEAKRAELGKGKSSHAFDALGSVLACSKSETFVALRSTLEL